MSKVSVAETEVEHRCEDGKISENWTRVLIVQRTSTTPPRPRFWAWNPFSIGRSNIGSKLAQHFNKDQSQHADQDVTMSQHFSAQLRTMRSDPSGRFSPGSEKKSYLCVSLWNYETAVAQFCVMPSHLRNLSISQILNCLCLEYQ